MVVAVKQRLAGVSIAVEIRNGNVDILNYARLIRLIEARYKVADRVAQHPYPCLGDGVAA